MGKEMIQKQTAVQETMFQHFKVHNSEYKESDEWQRQEIELKFRQQKQQEKEALQHNMEEELQLGIRAQEEAHKEIVTGGSGTDIDVNYVNKNIECAIEENQRQEIGDEDKDDNHDDDDDDDEADEEQKELRYNQQR